MNSTLSEKGQVTLPKALRDQLGLHPGCVLEFAQSQPGELRVRKVIPSHPISRWRGKGRLPQNLSVDGYLNKLRGDP